MRLARRFLVRSGLERGVGFLGFRLGLGERGLQPLQGKRQLIVGDALGFAAEVRAPDLGQDLLQPCCTRREQIALDGDRVALCDDGCVSQDACRASA